jgi:predicted NAD/FAD-binding protein
MNQLQGIDPAQLLFVSLNPERQIPDGLIFDQTDFDHPVFDQAAIAAQVRIGALQGLRGTRFADAHLGPWFPRRWPGQRPGAGARAQSSDRLGKGCEPAIRCGATENTSTRFTAGLAGLRSHAGAIVLNRVRA